MLRHRATRRILALAALCLVVAPASASARVSVIPSDVNGDGLADVLVTDSVDVVDSTNKATVIFGSRERGAVPNYDQPGARGFRIGGGGGIEYAEIAGDTNGDGLADVLVNTNQGGPTLVYGRQSTEPVDLDKLGGDGQALRRLSGDPSHVVGDINGDGLGDIADATQGKRRFMRIWLGANGTPFTRSFEIVSTGRIVVDFARTFPVAAGDLSGDGLGDLAFPFVDPGGRGNGQEEEELVYVVNGSRSTKTVVIGQSGKRRPITVRRGGLPAGRVIRHDAGCVCSVWHVKPVGDLNGDRRGELGIVLKDFRGGAGGQQIRPSDLRGASRLDIAYGSAGFKATAIPRSGGATVTRTYWVDAPVALGDVTGDGRDDLLVADRTGKTYGLLHGGRLARTTSSAALDPIITNASRLEDPLTVGDTDGDGRLDVRFSRFSLAGNATWYLLFGAAPLQPFSLTTATPGVLALTFPG